MEVEVEVEVGALTCNVVIRPRSWSSYLVFW